MAEANELITWLGVKLKPGAKENIEKINAGIDTLKSGVGKLNNFFFGASGAINYFKDTIMGGSQELINLSEKTGMSIEKLQKWKYAAQASGQSFQSIIGDLEKFRKIGYDPITLSVRISGMDQRKAMQLRDMFGISDDMYNILRQGPKAVQEMLNSAPVMSEEKIKKAAESHRQLQETLAKIDVLKNEVMMELAPIILEALKSVNEFVTKNGEWIKSSIKPIIYGLLALFAGGKVLAALSSIKTVLVGIGNILPALSHNAGIVEKSATGMSTAISKALPVMKNATAGLGAIAMGFDFVISALNGQQNFVEKITEKSLETAGVERGGLSNYLERKWAEGSFTGFAKLFGFTEEEIKKDQERARKKFGIDDGFKLSDHIGQIDDGFKLSDHIGQIDGSFKLSDYIEPIDGGFKISDYTKPLEENIPAQKTSNGQYDGSQITNNKSITENSNNVTNIYMQDMKSLSIRNDIPGADNAIMAAISGAFGPNT